MANCEGKVCDSLERERGKRVEFKRMEKME